VDSHAAGEGKEQGETTVVAESTGEVEYAPDQPFFCNPVSRLMCMIGGPLADRGKVGAPELTRIRRDAMSQRLVLRMQPQSVATEFAQEAREVA
jgi:hypothetical protein